MNLQQHSKNPQVFPFGQDELPKLSLDSMNWILKRNPISENNWTDFLSEVSVVKLELLNCLQSSPFFPFSVAQYFTFQMCTRNLKVKTSKINLGKYSIDLSENAMLRKVICKCTFCSCSHYLWAHSLNIHLGLSRCWCFFCSRFVPSGFQVVGDMAMTP